MLFRFVVIALCVICVIIAMFVIGGIFVMLYIHDVSLSVLCLICLLYVPFVKQSL